jgi:hypothetical protein
MSNKSKSYLLTRFETGDKPDQQDFIDMIDSMYGGGLNKVINAGDYGLGMPSIPVVDLISNLPNTGNERIGDKAGCNEDGWLYTYDSDVPPVVGDLGDVSYLGGIGGASLEYFPNMPILWSNGGIIFAINPGYMHATYKFMGRENAQLMFGPLVNRNDETIDLSPFGFTVPAVGSPAYVNGAAWYKDISNTFVCLKFDTDGNVSGDTLPPMGSWRIFQHPSGDQIRHAKWSKPAFIVDDIYDMIAIERDHSIDPYTGEVVSTSENPLAFILGNISHKTDSHQMAVMGTSHVLFYSMSFDSIDVRGFDRVYKSSNAVCPTGVNLPGDKFDGLYQPGRNSIWGMTAINNTTNDSSFPERYSRWGHMNAFTSSEGMDGTWGNGPADAPDGGSKRLSMSFDQDAALQRIIDYGGSAAVNSIFSGKTLDDGQYNWMSSNMGGYTLTPTEKAAFDILMNNSAVGINQFVYTDDSRLIQMSGGVAIKAVREVNVPIHDFLIEIDNNGIGDCGHIAGTSLVADSFGAPESYSHVIRFNLTAAAKAMILSGKIEGFAFDIQFTGSGPDFANTTTGVGWTNGDSSQVVSRPVDWRVYHLAVCFYRSHNVNDVGMGFLEIKNSLFAQPNFQIYNLKVLVATDDKTNDMQAA